MPRISSQLFGVPLVAFTIIQPDAGTSPTADSAADTLSLTSSDSSITITGNSTTDTIDFVLNAAGIGLSGLTDNAILRADGASSIQDSGILVDDSDNLLMPTIAELRLRDSEIRIFSDADGQLFLEADSLIKLNTTDGSVDIGNAGNTRLGAASNHVNIASGGVMTWVGTANMGNMVAGRREVTGTSTIATSDFYIAITDTGTGYTLTLPALSGVAEGQIFVFKDEEGNSSSNNITIDADSAETIDGSANIVLDTDFGCIGLIKEDAEWKVLFQRMIKQTSAYTPSNVTTDRTYDANATSIDEIADVLGTLITDLQSAGVIS